MEPLSEVEMTPELDDALDNGNLWIIDITDFDPDTRYLSFCQCLSDKNGNPSLFATPASSTPESHAKIVGLVSLMDKKKDTEAFITWLEVHPADFTSLPFQYPEKGYFERLGGQLFQIKPDNVPNVIPFFQQDKAVHDTPQYVRRLPRIRNSKLTGLNALPEHAFNRL
jgi:hypothetical protein